MKRILILTAGFGEGHNAAARGLRDALALLPQGQVTVEMHDIFAETYGFLNDWARELYLKVIGDFSAQWARFYRWLDRVHDFSGGFGWLWIARGRLATLLARFRPDVIVSVFPAYPHLLTQILGPPSRETGIRVVIVTDSITANAIWYRCKADHFIVANRQTRDVLEAAGLKTEKVHDLGFPVNPRFTESAHRPTTGDGTRRILYMVNSQKQTAPELACRLARIPQVELTVTAGRDEKLRRTLETARVAEGVDFEVLAWRDDIALFMSRAHLLISKAGGATVQETIAAGCPMIMNQVVPGQEEGNARLICELNAGTLAESNDEVVRAVERAFADSGKVWQEWAANIRRASRPDAATEIANFILSL